MLPLSIKVFNPALQKQIGQSASKKQSEPEDERFSGSQENKTSRSSKKSVRFFDNLKLDEIITVPSTKKEQFIYNDINDLIYSELKKSRTKGYFFSLDDIPFCTKEEKEINRLLRHKLISKVAENFEYEKNSYSYHGLIIPDDTQLEIIQKILLPSSFFLIIHPLSPKEIYENIHPGNNILFTEEILKYCDFDNIKFLNKDLKLHFLNENVKKYYNDILENLEEFNSVISKDKNLYDYLIVESHMSEEYVNDILYQEESEFSGVIITKNSNLETIKNLCIPGFYIFIHPYCPINIIQNINDDSNNKILFTPSSLFQIDKLKFLPKDNIKFEFSEELRKIEFEHEFDDLLDIIYPD